MAKSSRQSSDQKPSQFQLHILSNSPGEIASWVKPFATIFKQEKPDSHIIVWLTPCQYASGQELSVLNQCDAIDVVHLPGTTIQKLIKGTWFAKPRYPGAVLGLGGDPIYAQLLSLKWRYPAYAYSERKIGFAPLLKKVFLKKEVGDLMAEKINLSSFDRTKICAKQNLDPNKKYCLFFTGSRPQHFKHLFPLIIQTVRWIIKEKSDLNPIVSISPFISSAVYEDVINQCDTTGIQLSRTSSTDLLAISDMLVTIPGTNTAEAMYMNVPMLVVVPLNKPEVLIFDGLLGLITKLPLVGKLLIKVVIAFLKRKTQFYSWPNRIANQPIVPEYVINIEPDYFGHKVLSQWQDKDALKNQVTALNNIAKPQHIALKILQEIIKVN